MVSVLSSQGGVMRFNSIGRRGRERPLSMAGDGVFRRSSGVMSQSSLVHLGEQKKVRRGGGVEVEQGSG
jgi:hypothetical protein